MLRARLLHTRSVVSGGEAWWRRALKEPLLRFVVLGAVLFAVAGERSPQVSAPAPSVAEDTRVIRVDAEVIAKLSAAHHARTGQSPDDRTLSALVDEWIDEEVLYREAQALSLEENDPIVRRRMVQKMQFLTESMIPVSEPDDAALQAHLKAHPARYTTPAAVSFQHLFFRDGLGAAGAARFALLTPEASPPGDAFIHGARFEAVSMTRLTTLMGAPFATTVAALPISDEWSAPILSSHGAHLIRVSAVRLSGLPPLADVRARVRRDLLEEQLDAVRRESTALLRERFEVEVVR